MYCDCKIFYASDVMIEYTKMYAIPNKISLSKSGVLHIKVARSTKIFIHNSIVCMTYWFESYSLCLKTPFESIHNS